MEEVTAPAVAERVGESCSLDNYLSQPDHTMDARIAAARATLGSVSRISTMRSALTAARGASITTKVAIMIDIKMMVK